MKGGWGREGGHDERVEQRRGHEGRVGQRRGG